MPNLSSEDLLLYLCIHGAKHGWEYLELVCCVSELLKTKKNINWDLIEQLSYKWRCKNILYLGFYLSKTLLDAPVPESIYSKIIAKKRVIVLAREVIQDMFQDSFYFETTYQTGRFSNFHLKIKDTFYDRMGEGDSGV